MFLLTDGEVMKFAGILLMVIFLISFSWGEEILKFKDLMKPGSFDVSGSKIYVMDNIN